MNSLNDQTKTLRLSHAVKSLEQQQEQLSTYAELDFEERISLLLESEILNRTQTKIQRLKRQAKPTHLQRRTKSQSSTDERTYDG